MILVTGATETIAGEVVRQLGARRALVQCDAKAPVIEVPGVELLPGDLTVRDICHGARLRLRGCEAKPVSGVAAASDRC